MRRRTKPGARGHLWSSEPSLGLGDVDLNAVCPLGGRVLAEGGGSLGCHEPTAGFLALSIRQVQGLFPCDGEFPLGGLLWYWRGDLPFFLKSITSHMMVREGHGEVTEASEDERRKSGVGQRGA